MDYVRFGSTGLTVSKLCLGCMTYGSPSWRPWVLDEAASKPFFRQAVEAGINFFDTADLYSLGESEEVTGRALAELLPRHDYVLATKVCQPMSPKPNQRGLSRKHIMESIDASLKRLGTDYVDLYIIHRFDYDTTVDETIDALNDVVRSGKALYLGASSMWAFQFVEMVTKQRERGYAPFVSMQNFYNLVYREEEREIMRYCAGNGIAVTPWSPIARGFLAGTMPTQGARTVRGETDQVARLFRIGEDEQDYVIADRVGVVADRLGVSRAAVAYAWVLSKPVVTSPIIGASKPHHIPDAVKALEVRLSAEDVAFLEEAYKPKVVAGHS